MKINLNWGSGLFIFILVFFIAAFSFIYFSYLQNADLVDINYYPKEIEYQKQIDKISNYERLKEDLTATIKQDFIIISFPLSHKKTINGEIHIYRPSDASLDNRIEIQTDRNNQQFIANEKLLPGKYILKIDWRCDEIGYYKELTIII